MIAEALSPQFKGRLFGQLKFLARIELIVEVECDVGERKHVATKHAKSRPRCITHDAPINAEGLFGRDGYLLQEMVHEKAIIRKTQQLLRRPNCKRAITRFVDL